MQTTGFGLSCFVKKLEDTGCSLHFQDVQDNKLQGVVRAFRVSEIAFHLKNRIFIVNYPTSWILADNFSQVLFVFPCGDYFLRQKNYPKRDSFLYY